METRLPLVAVPDAVKARLDELGARPINLYRVLANQQELLSAYVEFAWSLRQNCRTTRRLRELMICRIAQICESPYELDQHLSMARNAGVTEEELAALATWRSATIFSEPERAALELTEAIQALSVTDETIASLKEYFDDDEVLELVLTASFYAMVSRVLNALDVPLDDPSNRLEGPT